MKLRLDLLEHLTAKDIRQAAEESVHRFKPEPNFSKTGTGTLSSASTKERVKEVEHSMALTRKLERRARRTGKRSESKIVAWKPGDRVKTLRGSLHGVIVRTLKDGRVVWKPDGTESELTALPESLCVEITAKG